MGINKVNYGNTTLIDTSNVTVSTDTLMQGYTALDNTGTLITGTATGGGSVTQDVNGFIVLPTTGEGRIDVLEYETGTWTPESDVSTGAIQLAQTHTVAPAFYAISDTNSATTFATNAMFCLTYYNWHQMVGSAIRESSLTSDYGNVFVHANGSPTTTWAKITTPYTSSSNTSTNHSRYWATETQIRAHLLNQGAKWLAGHTYKWIAVWSSSPN